MGKPTKCLGENKGADQLRSNCEADQRLCFRYTDSTMPHLLKSEFSSFQPSSVAAQAGLCQTWSKTKIVGFLMHRLKYIGVGKCKLTQQTQEKVISSQCGLAGINSLHYYSRVCGGGMVPNDYQCMNL